MNLATSPHPDPAGNVPLDLKATRMGCLSNMAHGRFHFAHWRQPLTAPGAAQACPACLPSPANQQTSQGDLRLARRIERSVRFTPRPSQLGDIPQVAVSSIRIPATKALMRNSRTGTQGLRPLTPLSSASVPHQRNTTDPLGFARPFIPSSLRQRLRLRADRIGSFLDPSNGVLGKVFRASCQHLLDQAEFLTLAVVFPVPDDRRDMHFPRGKVRSGPLALNLPPFLRGSGPLRRDSAFAKESPEPH